LKRVMAWIKIILPPLLLIPLLYMPFDIGSAIFWVAAFVIFVKSLLSLFGFIYRRLRKKDSLQKELIRPLLAVIIVIFDVVCIVASQRSADIYAKNNAMIAQKECRYSKECPDHIDGMEFVRSGVSKTYYGKFGSKYPVLYTRSEDGKSFEIMVRHNIDDIYIIRGGVDIQLWQNIDLK